MTSLAVQETQTSEAEESETSQAQSSTEKSQSVQSSSESSSQNGDTQESEQSPPDPRQQRLTALAEAERDEARLLGREEALTELSNTQSQQQRNQNRLKQRNTYATEKQKLLNLTNQQGITASDLIQRGINSLDTLNMVAEEVAEDSIAEQVKDIAYGILPKAAQDAFNNLVNTPEDVDLPTYLNHWVETAALHTKAVKSMTLEDAMKASSKLKREVESLKLQEYDAGREQGRLDPAGTSPDGGRSSNRSAPGMKSYAELEDKYGKGELNRAEEAEYRKLRAERAKSR